MVVVSNAIVLLAHDSAHRSLGISLGPWQQAFVYSILVPGPIIALLVMHRKVGHGHALLLVPMLGSLVCGGYHRFLAISPDHVAQLPPGDSQHLFRVTAALTALIQAAGAFGAGTAPGRLARARPES